MPILATKLLAVGFAASMAFSSPTLNGVGNGTPNPVRRENTAIHTAASSPHPSECDTFRFSLQEKILSDSSTAFLPQPLGCGDSHLKTADNLSSAGSSPLDLWLEKLIVLESSGKEHLKIVDNNGYHSYGCLQFQKATFEAYGTKYGLVAADDNIDKLIYSCELQKNIAKHMIEDDYANWRHWYTSVKIKGLGLPPKNGVEKVAVAEAKLN